MSILVTGFLPFLGEKLNPSQLLLQSCQNIAGVDTLLLPVSYSEATRVLREHLEKKSYDSVVMLGQAGGREKISLERIAINWQETLHADETGVRPPARRLHENAEEDAYFSSLPLEKIFARLESLKIPVEISFSAGAFVCNAVFFEAAHLLDGSKTRCGFIHIPYLPEQVLDKPDKPSMPLAQMQSALAAIISEIGT